MDNEFEQLLAEAESRPLVGWDLTYDGRIRTRAPWDFVEMVSRQARQAGTFLDLGTGGGEWLSGVPNLPRDAVATEGWPPNVEVARKRLEPLGVQVVAVNGAPDNILQTAGAGEGHLPFGDGRFDLVVSRHESYLAAEVLRVLRPEGIFLTQQVGSGAADDIYRLLGQQVPPREAVEWNLEFARHQLAMAGFETLEGAQGHEEIIFSDIGAFAWYLKNLPFLYPDFSIAEFRNRLWELHQSAGEEHPLTFAMPLFWLQAKAR